MDLTLLQQSVSSALTRPEVLSAITSLYAEVQSQIDARRPLCLISGRCCRFEEFGHRLYVTTLELAAFLAELQRAEAAGKTNRLHVMTPWNGAGCPFQIANLCTAHPFRPFGCRMFFCDATSTEWQNEQYEQFHRRLKDLHVTLDVPYLYVEWRQALSTLLR